MRVDPATAAMARALVAQWTDAAQPLNIKHPDMRDVLLATVAGLRACDHIDASNWGDTIVGVLHVTQRGMAFTIRIDGAQIYARTDVAFDDIAVAAVAHVEQFMRDVAPLVVEFEPTLKARADALLEELKKSSAAK